MLFPLLPLDWRVCHHPLFLSLALCFLVQLNYLVCPFGRKHSALAQLQDTQ